MALADSRKRFFNSNPDAALLDAALQTAENPTPSFFLATVDQHQDLKGSAFTLTRLGNDLERRFGISGEVAVFYVPWPDFQRRSFNAIAGNLAELSREIQANSFEVERFTPAQKVAILVSRDPGISGKIDDWQRESPARTVVVPLLSGDQSIGHLRTELIRGLKERLGDRDLYRTQNPVTGDDFFGRGALMKDLAAAVAGDENVAVLGLRRSGKTSVIKELKRELVARDTIVTLADFQMLTAASVDEIAESMASGLLEDLRSAKREGRDIWIGNELEQNVTGLTLANLSDRIKRVASRNSRWRFVIAVDEIEWAAKIAESDPVPIKALLGSLRAAAQACGNVSLMFSGVANRMFKSSTLGEGSLAIDNPIFGQVTSVYLRPFDQEETAALLRDLGRPMLLDWTDGAIQRVYEMTGGFPFFVRSLASAARGAANSRHSTEDLSAIATVSADDVKDASINWAELAGAEWTALVHALGLHYPVAAMLIGHDVDEKGMIEWVESELDAREAAADLVELGLLEKRGAGYRHSQALTAFHGLAEGRPIDSVARKETVNSQDAILALIRGGESHTLELKETARVNSRTEKKDDRMENEIVRAIAGLLNSDGGALIVGVTDGLQVLGIERDLALFGGSLDRFERWLRGDLLGRRIDSQIVAECVETFFPRVRGKSVVRLSVAKSAEPAWVDDKDLYQRNGNQTILLEGRGLQRFLAQH